MGEKSASFGNGTHIHVALRTVYVRLFINDDQMNMIGHYLIRGHKNIMMQCFDFVDTRLHILPDFGQLDLVFCQSGGGNDATEMGFMLVGTDRDEIDALPIVMPRHSGGGNAILLSKKIFHS